MLGEVNQLFAITGATGWLARSAIMAIRETHGDAVLPKIKLFSRSPNFIELQDGLRLKVEPYANLERYQYAFYLPLAFSTREKFFQLGESRYLKVNQSIISQDLRIIASNPDMRVILMSSGVVNSLSESQSIDPSYRAYANLKLQQELLYREATTNFSNLTICRLYSCSSSDLIKIEGYAMASFVADAMLNKPIHIESNAPVFRNYVDLRQLFTALLLNRECRFINSSGPKIEIKVLARMVIDQLGSFSTLSFSKGNQSALSNIYLSPDDSMLDLFSKSKMSVLTLEEQIFNTYKGVKSLLNL